jgi:hypothetical protein
VALTLTADITWITRTIAVTGTVPDDIEAGYEFRLDDELLGLTAFGTSEAQTPTRRELRTDRNVWIVRRGVAVSHSAGTAVKAAVDAFVSAADDDPPPTPFASSGGSVTPAAFVEPATATPEAIATAMIAAGLMEPS